MAVTNARRSFASPRMTAVAASILRQLCCVAIAVAGATAWPADSRAADDGKPNTPQAMFRALGVEDAYFDRFVDGKPLDKDEDEALFRVLFRVRLCFRRPISNVGPKSSMRRRRAAIGEARYFTSRDA